MSCNQYPNCACAIPASCTNVLTLKQNGGFPTEHCEQVKQDQRNAQTNLHDMIIEQNPDRRTAHRFKSDEVIQQANEMCNAWIERSKTAEQIVNAAEKQVAESMEVFRGNFLREQRKPTTSLDWELTQALIHLQNAISVADSHRGHLLTSALQITKGVRES
jgi:hypothetical protein